MYANYDMTFRFLRAMRPRGPWTLSSINPNGGPRIPTRTFLIGPLDLVEDVQTAVCAWLQEWNTDQTADVYFSANPTRTVMRKRPKEKDIGYCQFIAADFDPLGGEAADECQERVRELLAKTMMKPTFVWCSGRGMQAMWRLRPALKLVDAQDRMKVKRAALAGR